MMLSTTANRGNGHRHDRERPDEVTNAPVPGDDTVPSARAERRRAWLNDTNGIGLYAGVVTVLSVLIICIVVFAQPAMESIGPQRAGNHSPRGKLR